jgi:IS5 family transposase
MIRYGVESREEAMTERSKDQLSLADALVQQRAGQNERLGRIKALIDWAPVDRLLKPLRSDVGAPGYPVGVLMRALLLQQWYALSDPELEEALADRLSFRRFVGLALDEAVPDHSTLWRFREALGRMGLADQVFGEVNRQLAAKGMIVKQGTLIDATLVAAQSAPPASSASKPARDPDAAWTKREGSSKAHFGYKAHLAVDQGSLLVRRALLTAANVNDTEPADGLIQGDEAAVYADKAYGSHARSARLKDAGIKNRIMQRANKHHALSARQRQRNRLIAKVRAAVETVFAVFKRSYGYRRVRYFGLPRNQTQLALLCTAFNMRRALALTG